MSRGIRVLVVLSFASAARGDLVRFDGIDPGAGPTSPRPNSNRAAADFTAAAEQIGIVYGFDCESLPTGFFNALEVAPGVTARLLRAGNSSGIISGNGSVSTGYNTTPNGAKWLRLDPNTDGAMEFTFETPIHAFGAYFTGVGTSSGNVFVEFDDGNQQSLPMPGSSQGGVLFLGLTDEARAISAITIIIRNGSGDTFSIDDASYVGTCSGVERLNAVCRPNAVITAAASLGVQGTPIQFTLDDERVRTRAFGAKGKAKAKWSGTEPGAHVVHATPGCGFANVDFIYCGQGQCSNNERIELHCDSGMVIAEATGGISQEEIVFYLDAAQRRNRVFGNGGGAEARWDGIDPGEHTVNAVLSCKTVLEARVECRSGNCTGRESLAASCVRTNGKNVTTATLRNGEPGTPAIFRLDGGQRRTRTVNNAGKAKAKWGQGDGLPPGSHDVTVLLACGDEPVKAVQCP